MLEFTNPDEKLLGRSNEDLIYWALRVGSWKFRPTDENASISNSRPLRWETKVKSPGQVDGRAIASSGKHLSWIDNGNICESVSDGSIRLYFKHKL